MYKFNFYEMLILYTGTGVGRTGVTILADILLYCIDHNIHIDIPKVITQIILRFSENVLRSGADPLETAADDDGPDCGSVQVCPHCPHQVSCAVEAHLITIFTL